MEQGTKHLQHITRKISFPASYTNELWNTTRCVCCRYGGYVCVGRDHDGGNDDDDDGNGSSGDEDEDDNGDGDDDDGDGSGGDDDDEDDENFPEKVQSQEWRVEKFQCDPRTNSYQMIIFIYTLMV